MNYYDNLTYKDIAVSQNETDSWKFYIRNSSGSPIDLSSATTSSLYYTLYVYSSEEEQNVDTKLFEIGGLIVSASNGELQFTFNPQIHTATFGEYYYSLDAVNTNFLKSQLASGKFKITSGSRGTSALDWKPDAVSGSLGQVFSITNTSGVYHYAGGPVYKDNTSGVTLVFARAEEGYWAYNDVSNVDATRPGGWLGSIRIQVSLDDGNTLYDCGKIITSQVSSSPTGSASGPVFIADTLANVAFATKRDDYLYVYYTTDKNGITSDDYAALCVARASYSSVIESALNKTVCPWSKYYDGSFSQPGLNGSATNLITGYSLGILKHITGFYSPQLQKTVIIFNSSQRTIDNNLVFIKSDQSFDSLFAIYSDDGITFSYPHKLKSMDAGLRYFSFVGPETYLGIGSESLIGYSTSGYWGDWRNISTSRFAISSLTSESPELFTGFSVGQYAVPFKISKTLDRGQLHPYMATLHYIMEQAKIQEASAYYYQNPSALIAFGKWKNVLQSYANSSTELSGNYPDSFDDYLNYELGRDIHKFYNYYTKYFNRHKTSPVIMDMDGPMITSHALGSLIYNSKFDNRGSLTASNPNFITTNLSSVYDFRVGSGVFSSSGISSGTYVASSILNYGSSINEYRNSGILDHIELCQTSGSSPNNLFSLIDINYSGKPLSTRNKLLNDNVLIRQVSNDGFGRIIFDISKYTINNPLYGVSKNFLLPEHQFQFSIKTLISDFNGLRLGYGNIGIWIHTKPESNHVWSYVPSTGWVQHSASGITKQDVLAKYSHIFSLPKLIREKPGEDPSKFICLNYLNKDNPNRTNDVMASFLEENFSELKIKFNTLNKSCDFRLIPSRDYADQISTDVHRVDQNYVIEVFTIPNPTDKNFTLFYDVNMIDLTLNKMSKPFVTGIKNGSHFGEIYSKQFRVDLSKEHILNIIKYFNQIAGAYQSSKIDNFKGYASRVASSTSGIYEVSGGSRINYVEDPYWGGINLNSRNLNEIVSIIN